MEKIELRKLIDDFEKTKDDIKNMIESWCEVNEDNFYFDGETYFPETGGDSEYAGQWVSSSEMC